MNRSVSARRRTNAVLAKIQIAQRRSKILNALPQWGAKPKEDGMTRSDVQLFSGVPSLDRISSDLAAMKRRKQVRNIGRKWWRVGEPVSAPKFPSLSPSISRGLRVSSPYLN